MTDTLKTCPGCGKEVPFRWHNYCDWECHILAAKKSGSREHLPNGLPIRCIRADGLMLECENGDHVDYKFPVEAAKFTPYISPNDDPRELFKETHALIYTDGSVALTLYEANYILWRVKDGTVLSGPFWMRDGHWRIVPESLDKIRSYRPLAEPEIP